LGLYEKLRRRRDRLNESGKKKNQQAAASRNESGDQTPEEAKEEMKEDWSLGKRDVSIYCSKMAVCRELRKDSCKKLPGLQLLRSFPALNLPDIVSFSQHLFLLMIKTKSLKSIYSYGVAWTWATLARYQ